MDQYGTLMHIQTVHSQPWRLPVLTQDDLVPEIQSVFATWDIFFWSCLRSIKTLQKGDNLFTYSSETSFATDSENHQMEIHINQQQTCVIQQ